MALRILSSNVDGKNGHIVHLVRAEETVNGQTTIGPEETIGIWPHALLQTYHGPHAATEQSIAAAHDKWLEHHHGRCIERKRHLDAMAKVVHNTKGKLLFTNSTGAK